MESRPCTCKPSSGRLAAPTNRQLFWATFPSWRQSAERSPCSHSRPPNHCPPPPSTLFCLQPDQAGEGGCDRRVWLDPGGEALAAPGCTWMHGHVEWIPCRVDGLDARSSWDSDCVQSTSGSGDQNPRRSAANCDLCRQNVPSLPPPVCAARSQVLQLHLPHRRPVPRRRPRGELRCSLPWRALQLRAGACPCWFCAPRRGLQLRNCCTKCPHGVGSTM